MKYLFHYQYCSKDLNVLMYLKHHVLTFQYNCHWYHHLTDEEIRYKENKTTVQHKISKQQYQLS